MAFNIKQSSINPVWDGVTQGQNRQINRQDAAIRQSDSSLRVRQQENANQRADDAHKQAQANLQQKVQENEVYGYQMKVHKGEAQVADRQLNAILSNGDQIEKTTITKQNKQFKDMLRAQSTEDIHTAAQWAPQLKTEQGWLMVQKQLAKQGKSMEEVYGQKTFTKDSGRNAKAFVSASDREFANRRLKDAESQKNTNNVSAAEVANLQQLKVQKNDNAAKLERLKLTLAADNYKDRYKAAVKSSSNRQDTMRQLKPMEDGLVDQTFNNFLIDAINTYEIELMSDTGPQPSSIGSQMKTEAQARRKEVYNKQKLMYLNGTRANPPNDAEISEAAIREQFEFLSLDGKTLHKGPSDPAYQAEKANFVQSYTSRKQSNPGFVVAAEAWSQKKYGKELDESGWEYLASKAYGDPEKRKEEM